MYEEEMLVMTCFHSIYLEAPSASACPVLSLENLAKLGCSGACKEEQDLYLHTRRRLPDMHIFSSSKSKAP
jgi:hypothetical protein